VLAIFHTLVGGEEPKARASKALAKEARIGAARKNPSHTPKGRSTEGRPAKEGETKQSTEDSQVEGYVSILDIRAGIPAGKRGHNIVSCLLTDVAMVKRDTSLASPRMDKKSVRARTKPTRKNLREALKLYHKADGKEESLISKFHVVNKIKSWSLLISDAVRCELKELNIGSDLLDNQTMISKTTFEAAHKELLLAGCTVAETGFLVDEKNVLEMDLRGPLKAVESSDWRMT